ncbi:MAG: glycosyltransferase [Candidatus Bathyarchaeia archaeon]
MIPLERPPPQGGAALEDYEPVVGREAIEEIKELGERLAGIRVVHVNSTKVGGGVAEILERLVPLLRDSGVDAEWRVISGDEEFFKTTKDLHNALHGAPIEIEREALEHYLMVNDRNAGDMEDLGEADIVVVHDPQPAALIRSFPRRKGKWIWRCHIDLSSPNPRAWDFIKGFVSQYDAAVFHMDRFAKRDLLIRQFIVPPSIDPLSPKNKELGAGEVEEILKGHGIDPGRPLISQIGRFDRLKDPEGVLRAYRLLKEPEGVVEFGRFLRGGGLIDATKLSSERMDCQLALAGGLAADDPEGLKVYESLLRQAAGDSDVHILMLPPRADLDINAIQRGSAVVLQKSLKEGFALTVSEALWKGRPVVGGNAGGIPMQIIDGVNGFLVSSVEEAAARVRFLLKNPRRAEEMGRAGIEHVRRNFLITRHLRDHLLIYLTLLYIPRKLVQL